MDEYRKFKVSQLLHPLSGVTVLQRFSGQTQDTAEKPRHSMQAQGKPDIDVHWNATSRQQVINLVDVSINSYIVVVLFH